MCDDGSEIPASWENDGEEDCSNGEDGEWDAGNDSLDPSDAMVTVFETIAESTFENAMETFGQNLEVRLEEPNRGDLYHDAMAYGLWDPRAGPSWDLPSSSRKMRWSMTTSRATTER